MDNAIATPSPQTLVPLQAASPGFAARLVALPAKSLLALSVGVALLLAIAVVLTLRQAEGEYRVLFAGLSDKDGGAVLAQLSQMNIPYKHADGGSAILVPADKVHDVRLRLASAGLPKGAVGGFELMDNARFGQTQFQERLTFQRGLQGELERSIGSLAAVQGARVHLALPNQNGFFREQQKPSASVLLTLHPGRTLERAQVAGIVHLVSSSVPELSPKAVSVLDGSGALLSGADDAAKGLDAQQLQYVQQIEAGYLKRVLEILEPVVGRDNLRATVTADVDFTQSESTSEEFKPNQGDAPATVKLLQRNESGAPGAAVPSGVPGAASNQPPVPGSAPLAGGAQPLQAAQGGYAGGNVKRDAVTQYEVDKTVRVTRNATGTLKRLNAAVVVNHRVATDAKGKTTSTPLTGEELEKITALVQESLGFSKERGDSVRVINAPFRVEPAPKIEPLPLHQQPWVLDLLRAAAAPLALALVALVVVFKLIRPALNAVLQPPAAATPGPAAALGRQLDVVADNPLAMAAPSAPAVPALTGPQTSARLDSARAFAQQNPAAVAQIVKGWVGGDAPPQKPQAPAKPAAGSAA
ncbi:MAG TPA: flagellar basal-body MS-ring/collar protein FliF [Rubrivivax sp.]|nr:flagellar basal-body MS-ring/collar protein FliF [Rubrivivax sp.]